MNIPIVTLDKIYVTPDKDNIYFLDCTRINGSNEIKSRRGEQIEKQIETISKQLQTKKIMLVDDVVFSGKVLKRIIELFRQRKIEVIKIISSIGTNESYEYFKNNLKYGIELNYLLLDDVIDQICERDFYFGIAGSGIMVRTRDGLYKSPYFKPYGTPVERASIPKKFENDFSRGCIERSIQLWEEIDILKKEPTLIEELSESIINTNKKEPVVKTLKKEWKRL